MMASWAQPPMRLDLALLPPKPLLAVHVMQMAIR
jgi:hypothetical protein